MGARGEFLVEDHRTEEVDGGIQAALQALGELPADVLPERLPLGLPAPDILALEQGNFEVGLLFKEGKERGGVCFQLVSFRGLELSNSSRYSGRWSRMAWQTAAWTMADGVRPRSSS